MTVHAEYALRCPRISQVLDLLLAVATPEAGAAERLVTSENRQVFDFVAASVATIGAVVADEGAIAEKQ